MCILFKIGLGGIEHNWIGRPEEYPYTPRPAYTITASKPGKYKEDVHYFFFFTFQLPPFLFFLKFKILPFRL